MPIYEFKCKCGVITERYCEILEDKIDCPTCNNTAVRIPSRFGINTVSSSTEKLLLNQDQIFREPGLENDAKKAREYKEIKESEIRDKIADKVIDQISHGAFLKYD